MNLLRELSPHTDCQRVLTSLGGRLKPKHKKRVRQVFKQLQDDPQIPEAALVRLLFGQSRTVSHAPFQEFIQELSQVTLKVYLEPNTRHTSSPSRHEMIQRCERTYSLLYLTGSRNNEARVKLWQQLVKSSRQCHHISLELECQQVLQAIYGYLAYDEALLLETEAEIRKCLEANRVATHCKMAALDQRVASAEGLPYPNTVPLSEIESAIAKYDLYDVQYAGGETLMQIAIGREDWAAALKHSSKTLVFFRRHFPKERQPLIHFLYSRVLIYTALRDLKNGEACWDRLYRLCKKNSSAGQLIKIIEAGIMLSLRCGDPIGTPKLLRSITEIGGTSAIPEREHGRWLTYFRSMALLNKENPGILAAIDAQERKLKRGVSAKDFRSEDLLNMRILECLDLLCSHSYRKAAGIIEALRHRLPKRLSTEMPDYRLHLFLKLLVETGMANFHRVAAQRKTVKSLKRLRSTAPSIDDEGLDTELIPFERLWEILISSLSEKAPSKPYLTV